MQALANRCSRAQPFTSSRPLVIRPSTSAIARRFVRPSQSIVAHAAAADSMAVDLESYEDELDLPITNDVALPPAGDKVRLRIRMRSYEVKLLEDCIEQIQTVADVTGALFKGPGAFGRNSFTFVQELLHIQLMDVCDSEKPSSSHEWRWLGADYAVCIGMCDLCNT